MIVIIIINLFAKVQTTARHNEQWWQDNKAGSLNCANSTVAIKTVARKFLQRCAIANYAKRSKRCK